MKSESVENRVLFATSTDAKEWSEPRVMFNTTGKIGMFMPVIYIFASLNALCLTMYIWIA